MAEKWETKWSNNEALYPDFINDFAKIVLKRNITWRKYEQSISMPLWSEVEANNDRPAGQIKKIENTEWSYFVIDWFNYANSTNKKPESWNEPDNTLKDKPIGEHFDTFVRESLKYIFTLSGKKSDGQTIQAFMTKYFNESPGLIGSHEDHVIQFGDYTVEARGNSEVSNAVSPGLRFLVGINTIALKQLPDDTHVFGGSPGYARYFDIDPSRSMKIKIGDIKDHFEQMAKLLKFYQRGWSTMIAPHIGGGFYIPKTKLTKQGFAEVKITDVDKSSREKMRKKSVNVDLGVLADEVEAFGKALKELADKSANTPITYFMPKRSQDAKDEDIDIANVMKSDKWKEDPTYYDDEDIVKKPSDTDFASLEPDQIARTADNRFGKDENILEIYFTAGKKTVTKTLPDGHIVKYVPPTGTRVLMVTEYVPESTFTSKDIGWDFDQPGSTGVGRLGDIRDKRILLTHLDDFKNDKAVQSEMVVNFLYKIHHYSNVCKGPTGLKTGTGTTAGTPEVFASFLKTGDSEKLLDQMSFDKFVERYIYDYEIKYLNDTPPAALLEKWRKAEKARLTKNPSSNQDDDDEDYSTIADPSWANKYEKYYSAEAFTNSADSIMLDIVGGPTPPRVRLGGMPHPMSGIYKQVLNNADVKTLAIKMLRCMAPDRWLEMLCRYIFENGGIDTLLDGLRKSGTLDALLEANKDFGKIVNQVQQSRAVQQTEYVKLEHEKEQYNQEILRLVDLKEKLIDEIPPDVEPTKQQQKKLENINNEINDYEGRRQLVELDEYSTKYNASAGSYLPISHEQAEDMKRASRETARAISNLKDPNLKDKICKNILKYAIEFAEMIYNSTQSQKGTEKAIEKMQKGGKGEKGKKEEPFRMQQPKWPELPSDPISQYVRILLEKFIVWTISGIITETLKILLKIIYEWCMELQRNQEDDRPRRPGQAKFEDLLDDNPDEAAQAMCQMLDQYGFSPEACDVEDFLQLLSDIELLLSELEICDLFRGKPDPNVAQYVRNLLEVRYPGIFEKISRGEKHAIDAAIAKFFNQFENLLEEGYCEDLTVSLAEIDENFACCMPMPAQHDARCYLLEDWLTEEGLNSCIEEAKEEEYNNLAFALDLAAGKNPVDTPPIWCDGEKDGILPHDVEPLGFINDSLLDMVFSPIEATFRSDFHLFTDKYLKLAGSDAASMFSTSVMPTDADDKENILENLQGGMSNIILKNLSDDFKSFIPDTYDIERRRHALSHNTDEDSALFDVPDRVKWNPGYGFNNEVFEENTYEISIDNPLGAEGRIIYKLSPINVSEYTITITWKDKSGEEFFYSYLMKGDGTVQWSHSKLLGTEDPTKADLVKNLAETPTGMTSPPGTEFLPTETTPTDSGDTDGVHSYLADWFVDFFKSKVSPYPFPSLTPIWDYELKVERTLDEQLRELFNSMTISVIERFAFAISQSKFFDVNKTSFEKIFASMVPQQVFPVGETCHPENDASLIRVKAWKQYAKSRNKDIECETQKRWPSAIKQYNKMGYDAPPLAVAGAEGIILTMLRLYSVEAVMRLLPVIFAVGYDGIVGGETTEFITELILKDLERVDRGATPTVNSQVHDKNPVIVETEPYASANWGNTFIEEPPSPALSPRRFVVPIAREWDKTWVYWNRTSYTQPGKFARAPGDGGFPKISVQAIVKHTHKSGDELVEQDDGTFKCPDFSGVLGKGPCVTKLEVWQPPEIEYKVEPFVPKFPKHVIRFANQIMKNRTEKLEREGGLLFSEGKSYPSSHFDDLFGLNGIRFLVREQIMDVVQFFSDKMNRHLPNANIEELRKMWLKMLEYDGISVPIDWKRVATSNLLVDSFPRGSGAGGSGAPSNYVGAGRFFEFKTFDWPGDRPEGEPTQFNAFVPTDFYDQVKGGGFVLQPYIRAKINGGKADGKDFVNLDPEQREKIKKMLMERRAEHYLNNPKLFDPNYKLPENFDVSRQFGPLDYVGKDFPQYTSSGLNRNAYLYPGGAAWKNWFGRTTQDDAYRFTKKADSSRHRYCPGVTGNTPSPCGENKPISNMGLNTNKWTDYYGNRAERIMIGFLYNDPWVQKMWSPNGGRVEGVHIQAHSHVPNVGTAGWCIPKAKIRWNWTFWQAKKHRCEFLLMNIGYRKSMMAVAKDLQNVVEADVERSLNALENFTFEVDKKAHGDINEGDGIYFNLQEWHDLFGTDAFAIWLATKTQSKEPYTKYFSEWSYGLRLAYVLPDAPGEEFSEDIEGSHILAGIFTASPGLQPGPSPSQETWGDWQQAKKSRKAYQGIEYVYPPTQIGSTATQEYYSVDFDSEETIEQQVFNKPGSVTTGATDDTPEVSTTTYTAKQEEALTIAMSHTYYEIPFVEVETPVAGGQAVELDYFITVNAWEQFPYEELFNKMIQNPSFNDLFDKIDADTPGLISLKNIATMMTFYGLVATDAMPQFKKAFLNTKKLLRENFYTILNAQRYDEDPKLSSSESAALGFPNIFGPVMSTAAMFLAATPMSILKGLVTLIDPGWKKYPWTPAGWVAYFLQKTDKNPWFGDLEDKRLACPEKPPEPDENVKMLRKIMTEGGVMQSTQDLFFKYFADDTKHSITSAFYSQIERFGDTVELKNKMSGIFALLDEYIMAYERMQVADDLVRENVNILFADTLENLAYGPLYTDRSDWPMVPVLWNAHNKGEVKNMVYGSLASIGPDTHRNITVPYRVQKIVLKEVIEAYEYKKAHYFREEKDPITWYEKVTKCGPGTTPEEHFPSADDTAFPLPFATLRDDINEKLAADDVIKGDWSTATLVIDHWGTEESELTGKKLSDYALDDLPEKVRLGTPHGWSTSEYSGHVAAGGSSDGRNWRPKSGMNPCAKDYKAYCFDTISGENVKKAWLGGFGSPASIYEVIAARVPYYNYLYWDGDTTYPGLILQAMTVWNNFKEQIKALPPCEHPDKIIDNYALCTAKFKLETAIDFFDVIANKLNEILTDPEEGFGLSAEDFDFFEEKPKLFWDAKDSELADALLPYIGKYFDERIWMEQDAFYLGKYDPLVGEYGVNESSVSDAVYKEEMD